MIWFTADTHFGHANILKYCGRAFDTKEEHDEALISNWNARVYKGDMVYHLGDFGFGDARDLGAIAARLHGKIALIRGNHDRHCNKPEFYQQFHWIKDLHVVESKRSIGKAKIVLCHYALRTWQFMNSGSYHLYGHSHGRLPGMFRSMDVGVDAVRYAPISIDEVIETLDAQYTQHRETARLAGVADPSTLEEI